MEMTVWEHDDARVLDRENAAMVGRRLGLHGTERNWASLTKISALAAVL